MAVDGHSSFREDRNRFGGGIAVYVQNHIPVKIRKDLMLQDIEALWLQIHLPQAKPILIGCCYRLPSVDMIYLDRICEKLDKASDELYFVGDLNIDWFASCPLKKRFLAVVSACNLTQTVTLPTRISTNKNKLLLSKCIDYFFLQISLNTAQKLLLVSAIII